MSKQSLYQGIWYLIHKSSFTEDENEQKKNALFIKDIIKNLPCPECIQHANEFMKENKIEDYIGVYVEVKGENKKLGLFYWTWLFHNSVNERIDKILIDFDDAYNIYQSEVLCKEFCPT